MVGPGRKSDYRIQIQIWQIDTCGSIKLILWIRHIDNIWILKMRQGRFEISRNFFSKSCEQLECLTQYYQGDSKKWELSAKVVTAESKPDEQAYWALPNAKTKEPSTSLTKMLPERPYRTWAMGDYSTSKQASSAVLRIHEILVRIRICGSIPLTYGSGCGSCYFRQWPSRHQQKYFFS